MTIYQFETAEDVDLGTTYVNQEGTYHIVVTEIEDRPQDEGGREQDYVSLRVKPASELRVENRPAGSDLGGLRARWSAGGTQHVKSNIYGSNQCNRKPIP